MNFYNEIDPFAAAWLRELIKAGHIAPGIVDERSITEIQPEELKQYVQCHFFAGIGVWSYALRQAGWPDDKPVWTGSCPCQPFSTAGKRTGTKDERHLWPAFHKLIDACKPECVFGEQVESAVRQGWLDIVQTDLEGSGYTFGAVGLPACGFGAPHIRQRLYFGAHSEQYKRGQVSQDASGSRSGSTPEGLEQRSLHGGAINGTVGNANNSGPQGRIVYGSGAHKRLIGASGLVNGVWREADWVYCRDEKYRPVESGTFPLAHGAPNRVGRLRGYGNALVAPCAEAFITAFLEVQAERD